MRNATAVIPYRATPTREAGKRWVERWYRHRVSEVVVSDSKGPLYSKSAAINAGVERAKHDVLVIGDADAVICDQALSEAIRIAASRDVFVCATDSICYTTHHQSRQLLRRDPRKPVRGTTFRKSRRFIKAYGGVWAIRKSLFLDLGGMDETFVEWGWQDVAFHSVVERSNVERLRLSGPLFHFRHKTNSDHPLRKFNEHYFHRYYTHVPR